MQNKIIKSNLLAILFMACAVPGFAENTQDQGMDEMSADAIMMYDINGSLFQQITDLEQEKILMQLEKERAQLDLELDRLAAEKIKLHMEIDTLSGRAEEQQAALETERARLEAETAKLEQQKQSLASGGTAATTSSKKTAPVEEPVADAVGKKYALVDIIGAGAQLQATLEDKTTNQRKKISVGKNVDGYTVKSISLDEGVTFVKDGETETLNISKAK